MKTGVLSLHIQLQSYHVIVSSNRYSFAGYYTGI